MTRTRAATERTPHPTEDKDELLAMFLIVAVILGSAATIDAGAAHNG